jgi:hypothetical protein
VTVKKVTLALAGLTLGLASAANAQDVTISYSGIDTIPANNNFVSELNGLGYFNYTTTGASIVLNGDAIITFEFLGSESGYDDTFSTVSVPVLSLTETSLPPAGENHFAVPVMIGQGSFLSGDLLGRLLFSTLNPGGMNATIGQAGFGIFLPGPQPPSSGSFNTPVFLLGYDDQIAGDDDNHDDFIVRATVSSPVPEPATWAMMLIGFGAVGYSLRRRRRAGALPQAA